MIHRSVPAWPASTGILVAQQHCTPEQAFELLTRLSQTTHRKLRDCAADLVTSTAEDRPAE